MDLFGIGKEAREAAYRAGFAEGVTYGTWGWALIGLAVGLFLAWLATRKR